MTISTDEEETEINIASRLGDLNLAREAIREGCDVNAVGRCGWTPLHEAASVGNTELTLLLLNAGADPSLQDAFKKCTPLHLAAENGKLTVTKLLVKNGAKLHLRNAERKTPIDVAERECKRFLQSKRMEGFVKTNNCIKFSNIPQIHGEQRTNAIKQTENLTQAVNTSWKSDSTESVTDSVGWNEQNLGDIKVWFEYNSDAYLLKIAVWEVRDLRVPFDHNYSHLYVKCYILPDKNKTSKRKTSLKKLGSLNSESRASSSSSGCSTVSEESDGGLGRSFAGRVKASLSKRPHLHKKRNSDKVKCMVQHQEGDDFGRITTPIQEAFVYDALALSKVNMDTATVQLTVCGRNRRTTQAVPIASLSLSLAAGLKVTLAEYFPLEYKANLPKPPNTLEESLNSSIVSFNSDGLAQGSAWGQPMLSMSMPTVPTAETAALPSTSSSMTSGRFKLFKKDKKLLNRTPNHRYKNHSSENLTNLSSDHVSSPGQQHHRMYQNRRNSSPRNVQFRNSDLFMATVYRQTNSMQQHDTISSSSINDPIHRSPQQLIYSRALMSDKKKALNKNDVVVEDFDQSDAGINTPVHLQKSYYAKRNNTMLAF